MPLSQQNEVLNASDIARLLNAVMHVANCRQTRDEGERKALRSLWKRLCGATDVTLNDSNKSDVAMIKVKLTDSQRSALECAGLDREDPEESLIAEAWDGSNTLFFAPENRDALCAALISRCNAEDDIVQEEKDAILRRLAAGARTSLSNLSDKVRYAS